MQTAVPFGPAPQGGDSGDRLIKTCGITFQLAPREEMVRSFPMWVGGHVGTAILTTKQLLLPHWGPMLGLGTAVEIVAGTEKKRMTIVELSGIRSVQITGLGSCVCIRTDSQKVQLGGGTGFSTPRRRVRDFAAVLLLVLRAFNDRRVILEKKDKWIVQTPATRDDQAQAQAELAAFLSRVAPEDVVAHNASANLVRAVIACLFGFAMIIWMLLKFAS